MDHLQVLCAPFINQFSKVGETNLVQSLIKVVATIKVGFIFHLDIPLSLSLYIKNKNKLSEYKITRIIIPSL